MEEKVFYEEFSEITMSSPQSKECRINVQSSLRTALDSIEYRKPMPPTNGAILIRPSYGGNRITRIVELDVNEIYKSVVDFREILARNARERSNLREN
uniref:Uncharacterized protein n=1 Tax=Vespula pensylvanica TaxID=30213 RepID=A0A834PG48_VESPE|nr:hypothetical protein H0235_001538 [Vespula pensylvanica]